MGAKRESSGPGLGGRGGKKREEGGEIVKSI